MEPNGKTIEVLEKELLELKMRYDVLEQSYVKALKDHDAAIASISEREHLYRTFFKNSADGIFILTLSGEIVETNDSYAIMHGYLPGEMKITDLKDLIPGDNYKSFADRSVKLAQGEVMNFETIHFKKDGSSFPLEVTANLIILDGEKYISSTCRDISYRKQQELKIQDSEMRYRMLFELESDAIILVDNESGTILDANRATSEIYGYSHSELLKISVYKLSSDPEAALKTIEETNESNVAQVLIPLRYHLKSNGEEFPVEINAYFFQYQGKSVHYAAIRDITQRKLAEDQLRLSEETYRGLLDNIKEFIYVLDTNGKFLDVNKSTEEAYGIRRTDLIGKSPEFLLDETKNSPAEIVENFKAALINPPQLVELWGKHINGESIPREVSVSVGHYFGQQAIIAVSRDISERKAAELTITQQNKELLAANEKLFKLNKKLEENENLLNLSQKVTGVGSYQLNFKTGKWTCSDTLDAIFGIESEAFHSINEWLELVHPDWRDTMSDYLNNIVIKGHNKFEKEYKVLRKNDNQGIWVYGIGVLMYDKLNRLHSMVGTIQDITVRKESEEKIQEIQSNLEALIENTRDLKWAVDEKYRLIISNNRFLQQVKRSFNIDIKVGDSMLFDMLETSYIDQWRSYYDRALKGEIFSIEIEGTTDSGYGSVEYGFYPIGIDHSKIRGVVVTGKDMSAQRKMEAQMIFTDRMSNLGEMATGIAHEINQPLNNISMLIDNIIYDVAEKDFVDRSYIERKSHKLFENISRMRDLIDHIRAFARSHEDKFHSTFNVNESIKNALSMISKQFAYHGIILIVQLYKDLPDSVGSLHKFEQVILNLLLNSRDALEDKKNSLPEPFKMEIRIVSSLHKDHIKVELQDNGTGIDAKNLDQIFLPFFSTKDEGKGTGLGLSISFGIIKDMNGSIEIQSEKNKFTKVFIKLPLIQ